MRWFRWIVVVYLPLCKKFLPLCKETQVNFPFVESQEMQAGRMWSAKKNDETHIIDKRDQPNKAAVVRSLLAKMAMSPSQNLLRFVSAGSLAPGMQIFTIGPLMQIFTNILMLLWSRQEVVDDETHLIRFIAWGRVGAWWYCRYLGKIRFPGLRDQPFRKDPLVIWKLVSIISRCDLTKSENGEYEKPDELIDGIDPDW